MFTRWVKIDDSSNVTRVNYDPEKKIMTVKFKNGYGYRYLNVAPRVFGELVSADSVGVYLNRNIKDHYVTERL